MCAIAGILDLVCDEKTKARMLDTMRRRGPDAAGTYGQETCTLLHARLAIIDPEGGRQPMAYSSAEENYILVYNGELYNTQELRTELERAGHSFEGHSDTEVVLHSYAQWGESCVERFNGIFAFAVWEEKRKRLFLARDRIGVKPLFYKLQGGGLLFASEIKTILAHPAVKAELDEEGAAQILLLGPGRSPGSGVFKGVLELEPGCCGYYEDGKFAWRRYWSLKDREHTDSFGQTVEKVRWLVMDAIQRQMVSDVPIGTFLSGGLDSSLISAVCARQIQQRGEKLDTFSVDYVDNDKFFVPGKFQPNSDTHYIRLMEGAIESRHHWTVLSPEDLVGVLEDATMARDLPGMADVDFSLLAFCRDIRSHVKVALSGECADEIFGGYPWYRDPEIREADGFPWAQSTQQRGELLHAKIREKTGTDGYVHALYEKTCRESDILPGTSALEKRMKEMVNLNFRWFMQTLLDRKDRMSMYCGLEVRVPFCDYRIAEYLYGVPWAFKDYQGAEKGLLRHAMEGILPQEVLWRKKSPYPKTFDPHYMELVKTQMLDLLTQKEAPLFELVRREAVQEMLEKEHLWPWYGQLMRQPQTIAYLLQINFWMQHYHIDVCF